MKIKLSQLRELIREQIKKNVSTEKEDINKILDDILKTTKFSSKTKSLKNYFKNGITTDFKNFLDKCITTENFKISPDKYNALYAFVLNMKLNSAGPFNYPYVRDDNGHRIYLKNIKEKTLDVWKTAVDLIDEYKKIN